MLLFDPLRLSPCPVGVALLLCLLSCSTGTGFFLGSSIQSSCAPCTKNVLHSSIPSTLILRSCVPRMDYIRQVLQTFINGLQHKVPALKAETAKVKDRLAQGAVRITRGTKWVRPCVPHRGRNRRCTSCLGGHHAGASTVTA